MLPVLPKHVPNTVLKWQCRPVLSYSLASTVAWAQVAQGVHLTVRWFKVQFELNRMIPWSVLREMFETLLTEDIGKFIQVMGPFPFTRLGLLCRGLMTHMNSFASNSALTSYLIRRCWVLGMRDFGTGFWAACECHGPCFPVNFWIMLRQPVMAEEDI